MKSYKIKKINHAEVRIIGWDIIPQGKKGSISLSCSHEFSGFTDGVILFAENTNKLTELIVSVMNNTADFLIGINRSFLG